MRIEQLETPALILDMELVERNMALMRQLLAGTGQALRPHYKSHKCTYLARLQMDAGAKGITCAKLGEAEDLAAGGIKDILIANQIVDTAKLARLAQLALRSRVTVCVDSLENIARLSAAARAAGAVIHCYVEYEVGMRRCGAQTPEEFLTLAGAVLNAEGLRFDGIQAYAGHLSHEEDYTARRLGAAGVEERLRELLAFLDSRGIPVSQVSGASTGTVEFKAGGSVYTELQAGSYLFMDSAYHRLGLRFQNALFIQATVINTAGGRIVTDAGIKCCGVDQGPPVFVDFPSCVPVMSEEHSAIYPSEHSCRPGDRLTLIPGHCCTTMNLHDRVFLTRGGCVMDCIPITSRGKCM